MSVPSGSASRPSPIASLRVASRRRSGGRGGRIFPPLAASSRAPASACAGGNARCKRKPRCKSSRSAPRPERSEGPRSTCARTREILHFVQDAKAVGGVVVTGRQQIVDPEFLEGALTEPLQYMRRTCEWYLGLGYETPYAWAYNADEIGRAHV